MHMAEFLYLLFNLFKIFVKVGLFSYGGGFACLPWITFLVVEQSSFLSWQEFTDLTAISQITPGPIAINAATFVGTKAAGLIGAVVASFAVVLPSLVILTILAYCYEKYKDGQFFTTLLRALRIMSLSLIAGSCFIIAKLIFIPEKGTSPLFTSFKYPEAIILLLLLLCFYIRRYFRLPPIALMLLFSVLNLALYFVLQILPF